MKGEEIRKLVLAKLDEYTPYGPEQGKELLAGGDQMSGIKPVYAYEDLHLSEAANEMLMVAPLHKLAWKRADVSAVVDDDDNRIGSIVLPADFLRIHTLKMGSWSKAVHEAYYPGHPAYMLQQTEWCRGNKRKPVVTIDGMSEVTEAEVNGEMETVTSVSKELHYYSVDASDSHEVKDFRYVPCWDAEIDYDRSVAELIALHCARKVYELNGVTEQVNIMTNEINSVLENMRL